MRDAVETLDGGVGQDDVVLHERPQRGVPPEQGAQSQRAQALAAAQLGEQANRDVLVVTQRPVEQILLVPDVGVAHAATRVLKRLAKGGLEDEFFDDRAAGGFDEASFHGLARDVFPITGRHW